MLFGCDPEKVIVGAADLVGWQDGSKEKAFARRGLRLDWPDLVRFKRVGIARNGDMRDRAMQMWSEHKNLTKAVGTIFQELEPKEMHRHDPPGL